MDTTKSREIKETFGAPCDSCKKMVCKSCSGISSSEIRAIMTQSRVVLFFCPDCLVMLKKLPQLSVQVDEMKMEIREIRARVDAQPQMRSYAEVAAETKTLKSQVEKLNKIVDERPGTPNNPADNTNIEPAISELKERERRSFNLLIFGLKELESDNREVSNRHDFSESVNVIEMIRKDVALDGIKVGRLGKPGAGKVRPIRVTFPSKEKAQLILRAKNNLSGKNGVYIKYDNTPKQREYLKALLVELEDRKAGGEENLRVRYVNGSPKIIRVSSRVQPPLPQHQHQSPKN